MTDYCTMRSVLNEKEKLDLNYIERFTGKIEAYEIDEQSVDGLIKVINKESQVFLKNCQTENSELTFDDIRVRMQVFDDYDGNNYSVLTFYIPDKLNAKEKQYTKKYIEDNKHHFKELLDD